MGFGEITVAEIAPGILEGAKLFEHLNHDVLADAGTASRARRRAQSDAARSARLRPDHDGDFERLVRGHKPISTARSSTNLRGNACALGGVFQQWLQLHHLDTREVAIALATVRAVFPEVSFWVFRRTGRDRGLERSSGSLSGCAAATRCAGRPPRLEPGVGVETLQGPALSRLLAPGDVTRLRDEMRNFNKSGDYFVLNTDRNRRFEYTTPRFYLSSLPHREINIRGLSRFASFRPLRWLRPRKSWSLPSLRRCSRPGRRNGCGMLGVGVSAGP